MSEVASSEKVAGQFDSPASSGALGEADADAGPLTGALGNSPMGPMSPDSSAMGMNSAGDTNPRSGCRQRIRASALCTRPDAVSTLG